MFTKLKWFAAIAAVAGLAYSAPAQAAAPSAVPPVVRAQTVAKPPAAATAARPAKLDPIRKVGTVRLGASKARLTAWGPPTGTQQSGDYTEASYANGIIARTDASRVIGFEIITPAVAGKRGVTVGSSLKKWKRAYPGIRKGGGDTWLLDKHGNLAGLQVRDGRVVQISMVWRGGTVKGGGSAGRGATGNRFAGSPPKGKSPCNATGTKGWCWCTWWAYEKRPDIYDNSAGRNGIGISGWDAKNWLRNASVGGGYPTGTQPVVGAIAVFSAGKYGHVAYVESVNDNGSFQISEYNYHNNGKGPTTRAIEAWQIDAQKIGFIYGGPASGAEYIGHIVHWNGDTKAQRTAWYVVNRNGHPSRNWIPDTSVYFCLKSQGAPGPDELPASVLTNNLPDIVGQHATCGAGLGGGDPAPQDPTPPTDPSNPAPVQPPPPAPPAPPAPTTWAEQQGSLGANTFLNPTNASGMGTKIAPYQWVQVTCKVYAPQITSANPDGYWYKIASSPWNNNYYAVANTFWNGDIPGQKPYTHFTDHNVPNC